MSTSDHNPTDAILALFDQISRIPRCSKNERRMSDWLVSWAAERSIPVEQDDHLNVCLRVAATDGYHDAPAVVLQGHMDMVCEKTPDSSHDFAGDPIVPIRDGDWLRAHGTTLGADNGIAIAMALALVESGTPHPPLEILITVDEETGLTGAQNLRPRFIEGRQLINLDSEDEGVFTVGCAGGRTAVATMPVTREAAPDGWAPFRLTVSGLQGGHSGVDIHHGRGNANSLIARALKGIVSDTPIRLLNLTGGNAHNAIPRDAVAEFLVDPEAGRKVDSAIASFREIFGNECRLSDPNVTVSIDRIDPHAAPLDDPLSHESTLAAINLLLALPHGVIRMSDDVPGLVETSTNLAKVGTESHSVVVTTSQRSSFGSRIDMIGATVDAAAELAGATTRVTSRHPPWEPNMVSTLLERSKAVYRVACGGEARVEVIHAGLECGVIGAEYPDMEMISVGPTVKDPHSPDERLLVTSLEKVWRFLTALLASYGSETPQN